MSQICNKCSGSNWIKTEWPQYEVVMLEFDEGEVLRSIFNYNGCKYDYLHVYAQSVKGFQGYIYYGFGDSEDIHRDWSPIWPSSEAKAKQPVAVLFEKGE